MNDIQNDSPSDELWPSADYYQQIRQLKSAVGQTVYLAELHDTAINAGVKISDEPLRLLAVIEFPEPDPYRQLYPHLLILDDGRGVNLGRIARISVNTAFGPAEEDILYRQQEFLQQVLFAPRVLSRQSIAATSKGILSRVFGEQPGRLLADCYDEEPEHLAAPQDSSDRGANRVALADKNSGDR